MVVNELRVLVQIVLQLGSEDGQVRRMEATVELNLVKIGSKGAEGSMKTLLTLTTEQVLPSQSIDHTNPLQHKDHRSPGDVG